MKLISNITNNGIYNWKDEDNFEKKSNAYKSNFEKTIDNFKNYKYRNPNDKKVKLVRDNILDIIKNEDRKCRFLYSR